MNLRKKLKEVEKELGRGKIIERARRKRIRKNKIRLRLQAEGKAWQDWPVG